MEPTMKEKLNVLIGLCEDGNPSLFERHHGTDGIKREDNLKRAAVFVLIIAFLLTASACSGAVTKGKVLLKEGTVTKVSVSSQPESKNYSFDGDAARSVVKYLSGLKLSDNFPENPAQYDGQTWVVSIEYENGDTITIYHLGNMFIKSAGGPWYKMTYSEASRFDTLLNDLSK